jgi:hypothetical protein
LKNRKKKRTRVQKKIIVLQQHKNIKMQRLREDVEEDDDGEFDGIAAALSGMTFQNSRPLEEVIPDLQEVVRVANDFAHELEHDEAQPLIEVGCGTLLSVTRWVAVIKTQIELIMVVNPNANVGEEIANFINQTIASSPLSDEDLAKVLRKLVSAFKRTNGAIKVLEWKIREGLRYLHEKFAFFARFLTEMHSLSDDDLAQYALIHQLMGDQITALQRQRGAKIAGLREVIQMMNAKLRVYSPFEMQNTFF